MIPSKTRGLLFHGHLVRAILERRKKKTRRPMEPQPEPNGTWDAKLGDFRCLNDYYPPSATLWKGGWLGGDAGEEWACPHGVVGDRIRVRESYRFGRGYDALPPREVPTIAKVHYEADGQAPEWAGKLRPSIFIPAWASRIEIPIVSIAVEQLDTMTNEEARAEGYEAIPRASESDQFHNSWDATYPLFKMESRPWVWVIGFGDYELVR